MALYLRDTCVDSCIIHCEPFHAQLDDCDILGFLDVEYEDGCLQVSCAVYSRRN